MAGSDEARHKDVEESLKAFGRAKEDSGGKKQEMEKKKVRETAVAFRVAHRPIGQSETVRCLNKGNGRKAVGDCLRA